MMSVQNMLFTLIWTVSILRNTESFCFDVCGLVPDACDGKKCVPKGTCSFKWDCICDANSTSTDCVNEALTSTTQYVTESSTPSACPCVNGHCRSHDVLGVTCECNDGWAGRHCEVDLNNRTAYDVCENTYQQRPISERECYNWKCMYGVCKINGTQFLCDCDPGATGQLCQHKCCKPCVYGECFYVAEEQREICVCQANYSGTYCENRDPQCKCENGKCTPSLLTKLLPGL